MVKKQQHIESSEAKNSLYELADSLISGTTKLLHQIKTEEDLRIGFEKLLDPILNVLNIKTLPRYERASAEAKTIFRGRPDAVHGQVVIEYEPPKSFSSKRNIEHAYDQLVNYLAAESKSSRPSQLIGVGFDGKQIFFVQYRGKEDKILAREKFISSEVYDFTPESAKTLLIHLRALARLPLTAENLAKKFGSDSELAPKSVSSFADALEYWSNEKAKAFFVEWKRLFGIVYGEQFSGFQEKEAKALTELYKVGKDTDFQELLFSVHTYFAFLMKLIAAELLTLREMDFSSSIASDLAHAPEDKLRRLLEDIEDGGIYFRKGITNFLEGDFFRWYLDAWSPRLKDAIQDVANVNALKYVTQAADFLWGP